MMENELETTILYHRGYIGVICLVVSNRIASLPATNTSNRLATPTPPNPCQRQLCRQQQQQQHEDERGGGEQAESARQSCRISGKR